MESRFLLLCFAIFQVANSQYYTVPASSYASYYYTPSSTPAYAPKASNLQPKSLPSTLIKTPRNVGNSAKTAVKCSPQTASAYFLTPSEKTKSNIPTKEIIAKAKAPTPYSCALCNNFADVPKSSKIAPPPPIGSPVLPKVTDESPTNAIPNKLPTKDLSSFLSAKTSFSDMYEKNKIPKNLSFDQELLEGFLTGLGLSV